MQMPSSSDTGAPSPSLPPPQAAAPPPAGGWAVAAGRGVAWWSEGWKLFTATPVIWIVITLIYVALSIGLTFIPIVGHIAGTVLTPVLAGGVLMGCRALDRGGELTVGHLFAAFNTRLGPLTLVGVLYFAGWLLAFLIALAVGFGVFGVTGLSALMAEDPTTAGMSALAALGMGALVLLCVILLVAIPLLMAYWFAPALVALRNDDAFAALKASFIASARNIPPFLVYGLLGIVFAILATIPFALGWLVLGPVFAGSLYASYKDIFGDAG